MNPIFIPPETNVLSQDVCPRLPTCIPSDRCFLAKVPSTAVATTSLYVTFHVSFSRLNLINRSSDPQGRQAGLQEQILRPFTVSRTKLPPLSKLQTSACSCLRDPATTALTPRSSQFMDPDYQEVITNRTNAFCKPCEHYFNQRGQQPQRS